MSKKTAFFGILLTLALSLSGCAYYGGGYGHPEGYGYYDDYHSNDPFSYGNRYDYRRYQYMNDGY